MQIWGVLTQYIKNFYCIFSPLLVLPFYIYFYVFLVSPISLRLFSFSFISFLSVSQLTYFVNLSSSSLILSSATSNQLLSPLLDIVNFHFIYYTFQNQNVLLVLCIISVLTDIVCLMRHYIFLYVFNHSFFSYLYYSSCFDVC